ncbi:membrane protein insertase MisCA [Caldalkalibacillus thermarum]|uniref:membrane protein insertase YidC n=1 Tax=Caldalkalibacillus thermarum TaxID=296745 RepID=UPI00166D8E6C|nr:membrane protein insertase YidC [Caldalkalibacillus thermarum]GGK33731.1 membrane protein insertase MisCA [Caldalkalibacillus thermarum]
MSSRVYLTALLLVLVFILTGCNFEEPIDPANGIWDKFFVYPLSWALDYFAQLLNPTNNPALDRYGWAIVIVTVLIRLLTLPLMVKQLKTSKVMQALQPEMVKLREKYQKDQQRLQQEMLKLFQKHNVNPLAGCLPVLIQMPILIAFYHAIMRNEHIASHSFLWLPDLGNPDPFYILPVLAGLTTYLQQKMMGMQNNPQVQILMVILPIMIGLFAIYFPSALSLYWVIGNLFTIVQTYFMRDMYKLNQEVASK